MFVFRCYLDPKAFDATRRSQNDNRTEQLLKGRLISNDTSNSNINNNNCIVNNFNDSGNDLIVKKSPVQSSAGGIAKLLARDFATSGPENMVTSKSPTESSTEESVQKFACRVCPFTTLWEVELLRHEHNVHIEGGGKKKAPPRPIPNLIPIQNKPSQPIGSPSTLTVLKVPSVQNTNTPSSQTTSPTSNKISLTNSSSNISNNKLGSSSVSDQELNAYCAQSSSLKDFASLFHDSESGSRNSPEACRKPKSNLNDLSINPSLINKTKDGAGIAVDSKKKNLSFFDTLKEKLMVDAGGDNLICTFCGHESKCLSELVRHQKLHKTCPDQNDNSSTSSTLSAPNNNELFSTRCQHCRQRCKTSTDLIHHLKSCTVAMKKCVDSGAGDSTSVDDPMIPELEEGETNGGKGEGMDIDDAGSEKADSIASEPHPMENKVFVWNNRPEPAQAQNEDMEDAVQDEELKANQDEEGSEGHEDFDDEENDGEGEGEGEEDEDEEDEEDEGEEPIDGNLHGALEGNLEGTLQEVGVETAPGIGSVTYKSKSGCHGLSVPMSESDIGPNAELNIKRAYKCPHCSFWAATASRFHVHIVGHLNKKPFECSLCSYRSNWRWDITKHIRLKTARDPNHHKARVLMTDETGRRNYSKYNKYLTLIRVHEPTAESSGTGRRTKDLPKSTAKSTGNVAPSEQSIARKPTALAPPAVSASPPAVKRPQSSESSESEPPKKKSSPENKKTMWKCKKCLFRDSDRTVVLAHVKEHYKQAEVEKNAKNAQQDGNGNSTGCKTANQDQKQSEITISRKENTSNDLQDTDFRNAEIRVHSASHEKMANPTIKCYYCPFYVTSQEELIDHIQHVHGNDNDANGIPANNNSTVSSPRSFDEEEEPGTHETYSSLVTKRYKCANCPYVSNSKSQFLYHRQFHRPRGASFKCNICSYNVTRRHLLHQHLRVHGITVSESVYGKNLPYEEYEEILESPGDISKTDTTAFSEIPLVWVSKLGTLTKMFKCRYCPHVNIRKSNIQEHEKMHSAREIKAKENGSPSIPLTSHHCTECNYICNNAGVLSSHTKVHQGLFGQVCALYDASRCDEEQIKEINMMLNQGLIHPGTEKLQSPPNGFINNFNHLNSNTINEDLSNRTDNSQDLLNKSFDNPENSILLEADGKILHFCSLCPARFLYVKELEIHSRFHALKLSHQCESCSYTARQHPHLLAHYKVHTDDYQERTSALCVTYGISPHHPRPRTAVILDGTSNSNYAWVVVNASNKTILEGGHFDQTMDKAEGFMKKPDAMNMKPFKGLQKHYSCDKCPAKFFKSVALQYHLTLHGGSGAHKCRSCDYAVKTYGNLIKHETIHNLEPREKYSSKYGRLMAKSSANNIPMSGTDLFKQKNEALQKIITNGDSGSTCGSPPAQLPVDPEFGVLMHGSPEFTYPTYLKNGRLKEKRYKCHKCPSAFDKREQYKVHLSLHGAKQKYRCERCDYSVKYYANYLQHMKKHDSSDSSRTTERKSVSDKSESDYISDNVSESAELQSDDGRESQTKSHAAKSLKLSMADQQAIMLMQLKEKNLSSSPPETVVRCPFCPYSNLRKEQVNHHLNRHSSIKVGTYACKHCDYSVLQTNYSREHNKLHFQQMKGMKPDAYMKCDRIELWSQPADNPNPNDKVLIFQDRGAVNTVNRFQPIVNEELSENQELEKIYVNINTGEEEDLIASKENCDKENDEKLCNGVSKESSPSSNSIPVKENSVDVKVEAPAQESTANVRGRLCPISGTFIAASDDDNDEPDEDFKGYPPNDEDSNTSNSANSKNESDCVTDTAS